ncbi:glycosyl transferase family 8 [Paenibacillus sp. Soil724D2]|nr:glycosyl transferase family 8 [Paenibacillus sp. Soil724D2]
MQTKSIKVTGLQKSFKQHQVLKGVDFEVEKGSIFALLGSNGAGKTTVVKILTTLLKQDSGTATVNGFDVASKPENVRQAISLTGQFAAVDEILTGRENLIMIAPENVRQAISLTGQFAAVDEILTGRENLIMIAKLRYLNNPRQVADDLLNRFGLTDAADRRASTYSGGMRRRLDIALSLVGKPQIIFLDEPTTGLDPESRIEVWKIVKELADGGTTVLLDEPTTGLDPESRIEVWKIVKELADGGTTVLLTTQYLEEAEQLADRIAILHEGRIIANGTLSDLKKLFPSAKVEYFEKQPTLEEIFLSIVGKKEGK